MQGHPWIFEDSITKQSKEGKSGDVAIIFHHRTNKFIGLGLYDSDSPIRIKILSRVNGDRINQEWFDKKVNVASEVRKQLLLTDTNAYRLIFGENDNLPGVICDIYSTIAVIKIYSRIWLPYLELIKEAILSNKAVSAIVLRYARQVQKLLTENEKPEGSLLYGVLPNSEILFKEHGVNFVANIVKGHKTGFFLDHRHNRLAVQKMANGKTVLDVFAYAGGFSVHALCGGAKEVTSLDISKQALELASRNVTLNKVNGKHYTLKGDAFELLDELMSQRKKYDVVIIDPPAFAKAAKEIPAALNQYERLTQVGLKLVASQGTLILASCSSRVTADEFFALTRRVIKSQSIEFYETAKTLHDIDHPVNFKEGAYLKTIFWKKKN